ncbi:glycosyl transferase [Nonlabens xiamenensis]|uniref:glycosyl transferase n=1 Tax=Nonlabens xiamenensis TaxID=2341043 RepID=UPI001F0C1610|nr:glycosyl transferase [Nonlabens xiamenensis]
MKLSEIPKSLYYSLKIGSIPISQLGNQPEQVIPAVVSLTSIPSRLRTLHLTIRSMMQQTYRPEKIVLWLKEDLQGKLPSRLERLQDDLFEIRYVSYGFSHRKLIHSLEKFPHKIIITCDDDVIYQENTLQLLWEEHLKFPNDIIGNRCRRITYTDQKVNSYSQWPFVTEPVIQGALVMPIGAFCVLYPPGSLHTDVGNIELFTELAPKADDLWFKAMAVLQGTRSRQNRDFPEVPIPIMGTQFVALKKINKGADFNRVQWKQICEHYGLTEDGIQELLN